MMRQKIEKARGRSIKIGNIFVAAVKVGFTAQGGKLGFQRFFGRSRKRLLQGGIDGFGKGFGLLVCVKHLARRQNQNAVRILRHALRKRIKDTKAVHLVAKELGAHRPCSMAENINDTAAAGKLTHAFDRFRAHVAYGNQRVYKGRHVHFSANGKRKRTFCEHLLGHSEGQRRRGRRDNGIHFARKQRMQDKEPLTLCVVGGGYEIK